MGPQIQDRLHTLTPENRSVLCFAFRLSFLPLLAAPMTPVCQALGGPEVGAMPTQLFRTQCGAGGVSMSP